MGFREKVIPAATHFRQGTPRRVAAVAFIWDLAPTRRISIRAVNFRDDYQSATFSTRSVGGLSGPVLGNENYGCRTLFDSDGVIQFRSRISPCSEETDSGILGARESPLGSVTTRKCSGKLSLRKINVTPASPRSFPRCRSVRPQPFCFVFNMVIRHDN